MGLYSSDRKFGDAYAIPIIRATREEANGLNGKKLQVRTENRCYRESAACRDECDHSTKRYGYDAYC